MTLSELVQLRNGLEKALNLSLIRSELEKNSINLLNLIGNSEPRYSLPLRRIAEEHALIIEHAQNDAHKIKKIVDTINEEIAAIAHKFFIESYEIELKYHSAEKVRERRRMQIVNEGDNLLVNKIQLHSTWQYPGLEIGCRDGEYTRYMVASDPLYIADDFPEFLNKTVSQFTGEYQRRVRPYLMHNNKIDNLPTNQFGFIFSFNYFNYLSFDSIKQLLTQAMDWLRPGGTMIFTYNNADLPAGAAYAESYFMSYVPKSLLVPMCESLGFTVIGTHDFEPAFCWIEIQKPGTLTTVKAHQALGEIKFR